MIAHAADAFEEALAAVEACADVSARAGSRPASTYVAGAAGNLRHAMASLAAAARLAEGDGATFDVRQVGRSELVGTRGLVDTIRRCGTEDGEITTVHALLPSADPARGVWLRPDPSVPGLRVRGSVVRTDAGYVFRRFEDAEAGPEDAPPTLGPDLARDLLRHEAVESLAPAASAALQLTLAAGSWVHLRSGRRWSVDPDGARAIVRALGGRPALPSAAIRRLGPCVDAAWLRRIEGLGWRHWPTPGLQD